MTDDKNMNTSPSVKPLNNRTFGLIFAVIFALIALFPLLSDGDLRVWAISIAGVFAAISLLLPKALSPLNALWAKFGLLMHKITNPLLMGLVFFITVLPTGLILKVLRKDPMNRKQQPNEKSYWIKREQSVLTPESFDQQF